MSAPQRKSSLKEYQNKWAKFCTYLEDKNIDKKDLDLGVVLEYLTHLYIDKGLLPGTVAHYKTAITEPLKLGFNIDLHDKGDANLIKGMKTGRPSKTPKIPQWSLNKVLNFLVQLPNAIST